MVCYGLGEDWVSEFLWKKRCLFEENSLTLWFIYKV